MTHMSDPGTPGEGHDTSPLGTFRPEPMDPSEAIERLLGAVQCSRTSDVRISVDRSAVVAVLAELGQL